MKTELQKQLYEKYPRIFRQKDLPMNQTCMCWGIETGDGWYNILDAACARIQSHVDWRRKEMAEYLWEQRGIKRAIRAGTIKDFAEIKYRNRPEPYKSEFIKKFLHLPLKFNKRPAEVYQVEATQVKEKFGSLRFYYTGGDDYIDGVISMAESMSAVTCEVCGKPGKISGKGWLSCKCSDCVKDDQFGSEKL